MTFTQQLAAAWQKNNSLLCVGLDPDPARFPAHLQGRPEAILEFCTQIVDATADLVCCFKPQIAYFAARRAEDQLERLMEHMRANVTAYKVPKSVEFRDALPTTNVGKILRRELRDEELKKLGLKK